MGETGRSPRWSCTGLELGTIEGGKGQHEDQRNANLPAHQKDKRVMSFQKPRNVGSKKEPE